MAAPSRVVSAGFVLVVASLASSSEASAQCLIQKFTISGAAASEALGETVSVSGDTAVVGSPRDSTHAQSSGAAYIFERTAAGWVQTAKLTSGDPEIFEHFGCSVSISGDRALIGCSDDVVGSHRPGAAYVFERTAAGWVETAKLVPINCPSSCFFGISVSLVGDRALIGGGLSACIFERTATGWIAVAELTASITDPYDRFGYPVSLSGDTAVVGAPGDDSLCVNNSNCNSGAAYIFERDANGVWGPHETLKLTARNPTFQALFGWSLSIYEDRLILGAFHAQDYKAFSSGAAYVFERNGNGSWNPHETQKLTASDSGGMDAFGYSVSVWGDVATVGAMHNDGSNGAVYVFERGTTWVETGKAVSGIPNSGEVLGWSVSLHGDTILAGAPGADDGCGPSFPTCNTGAAYIFTLEPSIGQTYCGPAVPNSSGLPASIRACGSDEVIESYLMLRATDLPTDRFGYFLGGQTQGFQANPGGSQGNLCLSNPIGRLKKPLMMSGSSGSFTLFVDITNLPPPLQPAIQPGETWNFQAWFRDKNPGVTSNFTDAVSILFR